MSNTENIALFKTRHCNRRGQATVKQATLQTLLAADDFKFDTIGHKIDHLIAAQNFQTVDCQIALIRRPGHLQRTL